MKHSKLISFGIAVMLALGGAVTALSFNEKKEIHPAHATEELVAELNTSDVAKMTVGATTYTNSYGTWEFSPDITGIPENKDRFSMSLIDTGGSGLSCEFSIDTGREKLTRIEVTCCGAKIQSGDYQVRLFIYRGKRGGSYGEYAYKFISNTTTDLTSYSFDFSEISVPSVEKGRATIYFDRLEKKTSIAGVSNVKIYAEPSFDNVSLDRQGGSGGTGNIEAYPDQAMPSISLPSKTGYTFGGYYTGTGGSGDQYYTSNGGSARNWTKGAASTLYAKWTANSYTVSYNGNKPSNATGTVTNVPNSNNCTYDVYFNLGSAPSLTGWTFGGWYRESGCTNKVGNAGASVKNVATSGTVTLYAKWTANTYTVRYNANTPTDATHSVTNVPSDSVWTYDSNATLGGTPSLVGWTFGGWYKDAACTQKAGNAGQALTKPNYRTTSGVYNLYAKWIPNTYTIHYNGNKPTKAPSSYNVTDIPTDVVWTYDSPTAVTLGAAPSLTGYEFDGWYKESSCTNKVGNAGQALTKPNLSSTNDETVNLYAKWKLNAAVQAVVDKINDTKTCDYEDLTDTIEIADTAYNELPSEYQLVVDSEGYTHILDNAKAADTVGQMIEDLGEAEDTPEWREKVVEAREAYEDLEDKSFIPASTILKILEDDEAAVFVMNLINDIEDPRWTPASKFLIDTAQDGYDTYIDEGRPAEQIANHDDLVYANEVYDNVQSFVDKVNDITNNPFEYTLEVKELIDIARNYYENDLDEYQKHVVSLDAIYYYDLLVNYENAWNAMYLIDQINDLENTQKCGEKIKAAREAVDALDPIAEFPLMDPDLLKELTDKEAAWGVIGNINDIYPMIYGEECEQNIKYARESYEALSEEQQELVNGVNYSDLPKAEEIYKHVENSYNLIDKIAPVEYSEDCKDRITEAREAYDGLTKDEKLLVTNKEYKILVDAEKAYNSLKKINDIGTVELTESSKAKIDEARSVYDKLNKDQKALIDEDTLQMLVDAEHVYKALEVIDDIGDVNYSDESRELIEAAREYYDSLSDEQKEQVGDEPLTKLLNSETSFKAKDTTGKAVSITLLIFIAILFIVGSYVLYVILKDKHDDKKAKAMSVSIFAPVILASLYGQGAFLALYILIGLTILVWLTDLILVIFFKPEGISNKDYIKHLVKKSLFWKDKSNNEEPKIEESNKVEKENYSEDEGEVITVTDEKGNKFQIRFIKSFTAKLIQSSDDTKAYYTELKNEVLSYKKANSRISWHFDSINAGREYIIKFGMRGKTLCVYYPLNADDYVDSKYKVEKAEAKKYADVPCLYRINNDRRLAYAKELIAEVAKKLGLEKGEVPSENYYLPYEDNEPLLVRGLIKEVKFALNADGTKKEVLAVSNDEEEVVRVEENGVTFEIRYNRSYTAKLIQASDEAKDYYKELKNYILSYKDVSNRTSWHYESFNKGREQLFKFAIKGKTLCVFYQLDPTQVDNDKYKVEESTSKKFEEVPCLYRIKNPRRCEYAKELIDMVMKKFQVEKGEPQNENYQYPYESREPLLARGLIREVKTRVNTENNEHAAPISVSEADERMSDEYAEANIKEDVNSKKHVGKKAIINIDTIGENYEDGDEVTLESLIEKKLVPSSTGAVKVLARGTLTKKLHVDLQEYSIQAVKMILLEGGTVKKAK